MFACWTFRMNLWHVCALLPCLRKDRQIMNLLWLRTWFCDRWVIFWTVESDICHLSCKSICQAKTLLNLFEVLKDPRRKKYPYKVLGWHVRDTWSFRFWWLTLDQEFVPWDWVPESFMTQTSSNRFLFWFNMGFFLILRVYNWISSPSHLYTCGGFRWIELQSRWCFGSCLS